MKQQAGVKSPKAGGGEASGKYAPIEPGNYLALVESAEIGHFEGGYKGVPGTFSYLKITPNLTIFNPEKTKINRQDIVVGTVDEDEALYRPDGDPEKPALYSLAGFFISALGFVDSEGVIDVAGFDPELVGGQIIRVVVANTKFKGRDGLDKIKNEAVGFFAPKQADVTENGWFFDDNTGMVFLNEQSALDYAELKIALAEKAEDPDWGESEI